MLPFSALTKTEAPETSLRMSRPEAGLAMTPTVTAPGTLLLPVLAIEEFPDQAVRLAGGLHLGHVPRGVEDLDAGAFGDVLGVGDRDYLVLGAPDDEHRNLDPGDVRDVGLLAAGEELVGDLPQRLVHPVQPLELHDVVDELAVHQLWVGEQEREGAAHLLAPVGGDKALDVVAVDLLPEPRAGDEGERLHPLGVLYREGARDRPT